MPGTNKQPMVSARAFSFEDGICHLFPDRIEVRKPGISGWVDRYLFQRGIVRLAWFNGWLLGAALISALVMAIIENYFLSIFLLGMAGVVGWLTIRSWPQSFAPVIPREDILSVEWRDAVPGVSRTTIVIWFTYNQHRFMQVLRLPRSIKGGELVAEEARRMLQEEGLI